MKDRKISRANKRRAENKRIDQEEAIKAKNINGYADYTPYNAITGNDLMSAGRVSDPEQKLPAGFNTTKK